MTMAKTLRDYVTEADATLYRISEDTGIDYGVLHRFVNDERDMRLATAQKLADYFDLELRPRATKRPKPKRKPQR
jgi:hypothetical protein